MKYSPKQYAQALMDSLESVGPKDQEKVLDNFAQILAENNDLRLFESIAEQYHKLELAKKGIKQLEVMSAHPISRENEQQIIEELNKLVKGKVEIKKTTDESLIGGVIVRLDDQEIDASVKNQLEQLKQDIIN
ncbi:MAG: ATP synthase F1 subunit delta [Candidatus Doudnabacteria bacterium RIFCSPLOWO2_01_FULL_44_21]|uniref:ATP synthase subunit delta n=1 Tax=Candidatus Doudnabacteria bacterium RIFCSPLOWO2_01_FULL_44_21 TaxID=1817841 RepID=A0A1F5PXE7_9BACT|nr:MAG: ATP synthase F1 subunit delta [Candidatus Doudnabacteria bacterium RIFCSPHIGHO2_02_FULL_43_13b]OGE94382.1 MAG: ATP synthase F1 subunit delta [Candidatus Doudnabacteria bacterium RIFCSPLOWO2_01_FULL_44_21]